MTTTTQQKDKEKETEDALAALRKLTFSPIKEPGQLDDVVHQVFTKRSAVNFHKLWDLCIAASAIMDPQMEDFINKIPPLNTNEDEKTRNYPERYNQRLVLMASVMCKYDIIRLKVRVHCHPPTVFDAFMEHVHAFIISLTEGNEVGKGRVKGSKARFASAYELGLFFSEEYGKNAWRSSKKRKLTTT
jgi:hypothetical protein